MSAKPFGDVVLELLMSRHRVDLSRFIAPKLASRPLFEFIVGVVLSQNTSDRNAEIALRELYRRFNGLRPEVIAGAREEEVAEAVKPAGMHNRRAKVIKELARAFTNPNLEEEIATKVRELDVNGARELLKGLPGVGDKTADVILLMYFRRPAFPVDTHIMRISIRLGITRKPDYHGVSKFWLNNTSSNNLLPLHLLLITHGRSVCKARKPRCSSCPLIRLCRFGEGVSGSLP